MPRRFLLLMVCMAAARGQAKVEYIGGTAPEIAVGASGAITVNDSHYFAFYSRKSNVRVAYDKINLLEYGQTVGRRLDLAIIISPAFLLVKKRKHFLTVGYTDENGKQQALVFRVDKNDIRATLASLEARTGQRVTYQDEEARKAGRG
ncbi:MAG TPA: hypothetical protein VK752_26555 [Bryobacteraceae bacterium]|nr:hypothetical protein [Bryobacteraceae bacterium]